MNERTSSRDALVIERTFAAPVTLIWQMWTVPQHFTEWYGPDHAKIIVIEMDVRPGGRRHVCMEMSTPDGSRRMWFAGEYVDIVENERLAYTEFLADEHGNRLAADMPVGHADTTEVRVELAEVGDRTRMVLTHVGIASDSPGAAGWTMALDKLERLLVSN